MVKKELPNFSILLQINDSLVTNEVINLFRKNKIPICNVSNSYHPNYPYMTWTGKHIVGANNNYIANIRVKTKDEFFSYFFTPDIIEVW